MIYGGTADGRPPQTARNSPGQGVCHVARSHRGTQGTPRHIRCTRGAEPTDGTTRKPNKNRPADIRLNPPGEVT